MAGLDLKNIHVILTEDEEMFRDIGRPAILKTGIYEDNVHEAENASQAVELFERLQSSDGAQQMIFCMILDFMLPDMDGKELATALKAITKPTLRCTPFYVCCSSAVREVSFACSTVFDISLPKPLAFKNMATMLEAATAFWGSAALATEGAGDATAGTSAPPSVDKGVSGGACDTNNAGVVGKLEDVEVIVADSEMVCRMALVVALQRLGVSSIEEVEEEEEAVEIIEKAQTGNKSRPLLVLLGDDTWIARIRQAAMGSRSPFVVYSGIVPASSNKEMFSGFMHGDNSKAALLTLLTRTCERWEQPDRQQDVLARP
jgi:CheY-like chemotaxis protein